jgi:hypothetical protein
MSERLHHGRLIATIADVIDAGFELLPNFELAAVTVLDHSERPAEVPAVRRRLRAEGIRAVEHHGVLLLEPGDLDHLSSVGMLHGTSELLLAAEWNEEFEVFPARITGDVHDFGETTPLGLEEWMVDAGCVLALGDGNGLNFATLERALADRLRARFKVARR